MTGHLGSPHLNGFIRTLLLLWRHQRGTTICVYYILYICVLIHLFIRKLLLLGRAPLYSYVLRYVTRRLRTHILQGLYSSDLHFTTNCTTDFTMPFSDTWQRDWGRTLCKALIPPASHFTTHFTTNFSGTWHGDCGRRLCNALIPRTTLHCSTSPARPSVCRVRELVRPRSLCVSSKLGTVSVVN